MDAEIFLFSGLALSGISARVSLLSMRGGFLRDAEAAKSITRVFLEVIGGVVGITAFVISFLMFKWWLPIIAAAIGFWLIGPTLVGRNSFWVFF